MQIVMEKVPAMEVTILSLIACHIFSLKASILGMAHSNKLNLVLSLCGKCLVDLPRKNPVCCLQRNLCLMFDEDLPRPINFFFVRVHDCHAASNRISHFCNYNHTQKHGSDSMTSTADSGGKDLFLNQEMNVLVQENLEVYIILKKPPMDQRL